MRERELLTVHGKTADINGYGRRIEGRGGAVRNTRTWVA